MVCFDCQCGFSCGHEDAFKRHLQRNGGQQNGHIRIASTDVTTYHAVLGNGKADALCRAAGVARLDNIQLRAEMDKLKVSCESFLQIEMTNKKLLAEVALQAAELDEALRARAIADEARDRAQAFAKHEAYAAETEQAVAYAAQAESEVYEVSEEILRRAAAEADERKCEAEYQAAMSDENAAEEAMKARLAKLSEERTQQEANVVRAELTEECRLFRDEAYLAASLVSSEQEIAVALQRAMVQQVSDVGRFQGQVARLESEAKLESAGVRVANHELKAQLDFHKKQVELQKKQQELAHSKSQLQAAGLSKTSGVADHVWQYVGRQHAAWVP